VFAVTEESKFKGVQHVNVERTVEAVIQQLKTENEVELVTRQS
jgi:hypothetical protein